jgi:putative endonuclease
MSSGQIDANGNSTIMSESPWYVYLLECADGTLYCGVAKDVSKRLAQHNGTIPGGARYTSGRRPVRLLGSRECETQREALRLERRVKRLPRGEKLSCILGV